jgi:hypothetical protein
MPAKMARSVPSAVVRSVNGDGSRPRPQPLLPKRWKSAKICASSRVIRGIPDNFKNYLNHDQQWIAVY